MKKFSKCLLSHFGYKISKIPRVENAFGRQFCLNFQEPSTVRSLLFSHCYLQSEDFFFIQIGANDGVMDDPIYNFVQRYNLSGIAVEPIDDYYQELKESYGTNNNVITVKKAIHPYKDKEIIYRLRKDHPFHKYYHGVGSFNLDHLLKFKDPRQTPKEWLIPNIEEYILEEEVECITFERLISEYKVKKIDLLQIDTEGFDFEIIKMVDFGVVKPRLIRYEVVNLKKEDVLSSINHLIGRGYKIFDEGPDVIASTMEL